MADVAVQWWSLSWFCFSNGLLALALSFVYADWRMNSLTQCCLSISFSLIPRCCFYHWSSSTFSGVEATGEESIASPAWCWSWLKAPGLMPVAEARRERPPAEYFLPGDACCAQTRSCLWTFFDRDYWILVTPGTQLLVLLPTLEQFESLCVITLINTVRMEKSL